MNMIQLTVNDHPVMVPEGTTVLDAAKKSKMYTFQPFVI